MKYLASVYIVFILFAVGWLFREYMPLCTIESADENVKKQECSCTGYELTLRDDLDIGGVKKTTCLGVMEQKECYLLGEEGLEPVRCQ